MPGRFDVFRRVLLSPTLRRVELAFLAFSVAEWATWVGIVVYAYGRGGAGEAGLVAAIQLLPSLVVAPLASVLGDRYPRAVVLVGTYGLQAGAMAAAAAALATDAPPPVVYALATVTATAITLTRPLQSSLLPEVLATPDEVCAANVASGSVESGGGLLGPVLASLLLAFGGPALVFAACALGMAGSVAILLPVARRARRVMVAPRAEAAPDVPGPSLLATTRNELVGGLTAIGADRRLLAVVVVAAVGWLVLGALDILYAVLAIDVLGLGDEGVGLLGAATGLGMLAGSGASIALVGRRHLAGAALLAAVACGLAVAGVALGPLPVVVVLLAVAGSASTVLAVVTQTLTQRLAPRGAMTRVFGVLEALGMGMTAVGALVVPVFIEVVGVGGALVATGLLLPAATALALAGLRAADRAGHVSADVMRLIHRVPMFAPLGPAEVEGLAAAVVPVAMRPGDRIISQGDHGDRFYVIVTGTVEVLAGDTLLRTQGAGESFGEIALLRDVPRTATVRAVTEGELLALDREPFLEAVTRQPASHAAASAIVAERLAAG